MLRLGRVLLASCLVLFAGCGADASSPNAGQDPPTNTDAGGDAEPLPDGSHDAEASPPEAATLDSQADAAEEQDSSLPDSPEAGPAVLTGILVGGTGDYPGGIAGVLFRSGGQSGVTDSSGTFSYEQGSPVTFGISDVEFRPAPGAPMVSPWQLAASGECTQGSELARLLVLLQSLDDDNDPATGTHIATYPKGTPVRPLGSLADADVADLVAQLIPGRTPVAADEAVHRFILQMDGEVWTELSMETFNAADSAIRSQGVTTDGTYWYFSWRLGLTKTDLSLATVMKNSLAIPPLLALQGSDHIGDIDYWNDKLYVPIEDSNGYQHPYVVLYDTDMNAGQQFSIPQALMTGGVPWVAVDGPRASLYLAEWDPTPGIHVFSLSNLTYQTTIGLSTTLGRIQGAKVFEGALYANADDDDKTVYKINLETGTVIELFSLQQPVEVEGLAFLDRPDGSQLHTMNTTTSYTAMEFRHHQRTREPLRKAVCP